MNRQRQHKWFAAFRRRSIPDKIIFSVVFVVFLVYAFTLIYPFVWGFFSSLKSPREYRNSPDFLPHDWLWENYLTAFNELKVGDSNLLSMVWNSVWFSVGSMVISLFFTALTAYILSQYDFKGKRLLKIVNMLVVFLPVYGAFASTYRFYYETGMVDSYLILLSATGGFSFNTMLLTGYFSSISKTYAEAAQVDGAGHFKTYYKVMLPQATPMLLALFLLGFIAKWNDYMTPILYLENMPTLATGLYRYQETAMRKDLYPTLYAGLFISLVPVMALFAVFSKPMMTNVSVGGIKG
jgi:ABC transporter, permease protein